MLLKYKSFLVGIVLMLGVALALCISSISARAADVDVTDGLTTITTSDNNFNVRGYNFNGFASFDYFDTYTLPNDPTVTASNYNCTSDIYINFSVAAKTPLFGQYVSGGLTFSFKPQIILTSRQGYTYYNCRYTLADETPYLPEGVSCSSSRNDNGNYLFAVHFHDWYCDGAERISFLLHFRITSFCGFSGATVTAPITPPISLTFNNFGITYDQLMLYSIPLYQMKIADAIDMSDDIDSILYQLDTLNAHTVWSDGVVVYDLADLAYMQYANGMTTNNWLQSIYNNMSVDSSGQASSLGSQADAVAQLESNAEQSVSTIMNGIASDSNYNLALQDIGNVNTNGFYNDNTIAFTFWKNCGNWILDSNNLGYISIFLTIVLVLGFVVWILAL